ncbi:MAG TPA: universal stress protein [candidate division Zixibacteria bacterium]|nr:universal stress protein [candidate division Zixibacteria bacterium]
MYGKIIVPLDGSRLAEQILPYVRWFASACDARVELLLVNDPDVATGFFPPLEGGGYLEQVRDRYLRSVSRVDMVTETGKPAAVIVDRAGAGTDSLIAMATHGLSGIQRWLLGSVTSKVVQAARASLLLIRPAKGQDPSADIRLRTVFVPLDGSALAENALARAVELARKTDLEIHLVRVYGLPPDAYILGDGVYMNALMQQREAIRREAESYLESKVEELRAQGLERVLSSAIAGDPAGDIIDLASRTPDNLIAMSTHGRSGIQRWIMGSVTEKVVHYSRDPVLVVRPAGG